MSTPVKAPYQLTKHFVFSDVERDCPRAIELLAEFELACGNCAHGEVDTIESAAQRHGMSLEETRDMIVEINQQLDKEWRADS